MRSGYVVMYILLLLSGALMSGICVWFWLGMRSCGS